MIDERSIEKPPNLIDDKTIKENFGIKLSELRKQKGLSRKQLAELFSLSEVTVGAYERGLRQPNFETLYRLADFFDVTIDELIGRDSTAQYDEVIQVYRFHNAVELLELVGEVVTVIPKNKYALIVRTKDDNFQTDEDGNVKRVDKGNDCITFGREKDLIDFAETIQGIANISNQTFSEIFWEKAEKLSTNPESLSGGLRLIDYKRGFIAEKWNIHRLKQ